MDLVQTTGQDDWSGRRGSDETCVHQVYIRARIFLSMLKAQVTLNSFPGDLICYHDFFTTTVTAFLNSPSISVYFIDYMIYNYFECICGVNCNNYFQ